MNFLEAISTCLKKYTTFEGRAGRPEFWYWTLFSWLLSVIGSTIDAAIMNDAGVAVVSNVVILAIALPSLAVSIRRLHDVGRSGWWFLLAFTGIGIFVLLYWYIRPGNQQSEFSEQTAQQSMP
ncbi:DUF805 domain-containing protein [Cohaesibacter haloalkalitolerans]|uniref:DUF805 domain-containing protein n=1 Tax=Cohaesibacter haloalkalitolerans TaxID=1162980 RepID=UPI000E65B72B|nr:DUF805 domain-containing protein [Cohaesibacter haloalkalitolerans]